MQPDWTVEKLNKSVCRVNMNVDRITGWEQWFLLSSDRHHDNAHTNWSKEKEHLNQVKQRGAGIIDAGDMHCAMQGKFDPRQDRSQLRDEYRGGDYLDALVREAASFYGTEYGPHWIVIGRGNHETSIYSRHQTDLTERTVQAIKMTSPESPVVSGGYGGWVIFRIKRTTSTFICRLKFFHGAGGGGPVTRGVIQTNRMAVYLPDADIILTGHTHDQWMVPIARERLTAHGNVKADEQLHLRSGTYKDEYFEHGGVGGHSGWHVERFGPPKPTPGAWWLRFYFTDKDTLEWEAIRAT